MSDLCVGIDCSTTACKAIAWDARGTAVAEGRAAIALDNPEPDGWEQDAGAWWSALCAASRSMCAQIDPARIGAVCVTHQRETFVITDTAGVPLHPALVWMDARGVAQVSRAIDALGREHIHRISGKPPCITPSFYKLLALLERQPALRRDDARVCEVHALMVWRLSGRLATSLASADPTGMLDMQARAWSEPLLAHAGLEAAQLPPLHEAGSLIGHVSAEAAAQTGLRAGTPIAAGAGDGQAAGLGAGIVAPGTAYLNLGTAVVSGVLSPSYATDDRFRTLYAASGGYFLETDLQGGTFTLNWLADRFGVSLDALEARARGLPRGADGLVLVPYWNGVMNPYWDDEATGIVIGWRGSHGPEHLYRAIIEGIAFEQRLHLEGVEAASGHIAELVAMGGGSKSDLWCQILADVLEKPIVRAGSSEATALGAGMLASVAAGLHPDVVAAGRAMTTRGARFEPGEGRAFYDRLYREVYRDLFPALRPALQRLWRIRS